MRKWLYERPWIWIVLFLGTLIAGSIATVIIAEVNKPEIVKPKTPRKSRAGAVPPHSSIRAWIGPLRAADSRFTMDTGAASRRGADGPAAGR